MSTSKPADREFDPPQAVQAAGEQEPGRFYSASPNSRWGRCFEQARICKEG